MQIEDPQAQAANLDALVEEIEALPDPALRGKMANIVSALLSLYGDGLARIIDIVARQGDPAASAALLAAFAQDELISHLLMLHDLHPVDIEERVAAALEEVRPYLKMHGGNVELIRVEDGVAYLQLQGHCNGCPSSTATLKHSIEEAIHRAAPDLLRIEAEGVTEPKPQPQAFIPLGAVRTISAAS
jgi:Fe-S cluster biogenesis protein NfuA